MCVTEVRNGVRSYGCWGKQADYQAKDRLTMDPLEELDPVLSGYVPHREDPWTLCKQATDNLVGCVRDVFVQRESVFSFIQQLHGEIQFSLTTILLCSTYCCNVLVYVLRISITHANLCS